MTQTGSSSSRSLLRVVPRDQPLAGEACFTRVLDNDSFDVAFSHIDTEITLLPVLRVSLQGHSDANFLHRLLREVHFFFSATCSCYSPWHQHGSSSVVLAHPSFIVPVSWRLLRYWLTLVGPEHPQPNFLICRRCCSKTITLEAAQSQDKLKFIIPI